jgi:hypothetical protein
MKQHKTIISIATAIAALALPGTAFAQAWSHSSIKSVSTEVAPGNGTVNAGFIISGEAQEGAGAQTGGGRSTQRNTTWAKLLARTYTVASLSGMGRSTATWGVSRGTGTTLTGTLFGQTLLNQSKTCGDSCVSTSSRQVTANISDPIIIWDYTVLGVGVRVSGRLKGSMGYAFNAQATSKPLGGFADMSTLASNGANGTVQLAITGAAGVLGIIEAGVGPVIDIVRANIGASVSDRMIVNSRTDLDLSWRNVAPLTLSTGGGSVVGEVCAIFCVSHTFFTWPSFSKTFYAYADAGALNNQSF